MAISREAFLARLRSCLAEEGIDPAAADRFLRQFTDALDSLSPEDAAAKIASFGRPEDLAARVAEKVGTASAPPSPADAARRVTSERAPQPLPPEDAAPFRGQNERPRDGQSSRPQGERASDGQSARENSGQSPGQYPRKNPAGSPSSARSARPRPVDRAVERASSPQGQARGNGRAPARGSAQSAPSAYPQTSPPRPAPSPRADLPGYAVTDGSSDDKVTLDARQKRNFLLTVVLTSPLWGFLLCCVIALFLLGYTAVFLLSAALVVGEVVLVLGGVLLAVIGIVYGVTKMLPGAETPYVGLYELGLGIRIGGVVLLVAILIYNLVLNGAPFAVRQLNRLARFAARGLSRLVNNLQRRFAAK